MGTPPFFPVISFARETTNLISIAENLINKENSRYTVVFSILPFGNHVKKFGLKFNQGSLLSKSNLPCIRQLRPQYERQSKLGCPTETTR